MTKQNLLFLSLILIIGFAIPTPGIDAQDENNASAWFEAETRSPLVGQPIQLILKVNLPLNAAITTWPNIPVGWLPFQVSKVDEVKETISGDKRAYQQAITITLWNLGEYHTPETIISYQYQGQVFRIRAQEAFFTVPSSLDQTDLELRALKPPIWFPYTSPWLMIIIGVVITLVITSLIWWWRLKQRDGTKLHDVATPVGRAFAELKSLGEQGIAPTTLFPMVANCLRVYIQDRYDLRAQDMTTNELISALHTQGYLPQRAQKELQRILEYADLVKFASFQPGKQSAHQLLQVAGSWLERAEIVAPVAEESQVH